MKKTILFLAALCSGAAQANDDKIVVHECDFNNGIPTDYATYDMDEQPIHFTMAQLGFDQGDAWTALREHGNNSNLYAASTSKHKLVDNTTQNANDWLITPCLHIPTDDAVLTWRAQSVCESTFQGDTYEVYISTTGNRPDDFVNGKAMTISGESVNEWTTRELPLGQYSGQDIYIAFVNRSYLCEVLAIDDICVKSSPGFCEVVEQPYSYYYGSETIQPFGKLHSNSSTPITTFTAYCEIGGNLLEKTFSNVNLTMGDTLEYAFDKAFPTSYGDTLRYKTWVAIDGRTTGAVQANVVPLLFEPRQATVFEEGTGMWCGYCPTGIVAMNRLKEKYPNEFIGIAIHYNDALEVPGYSDVINFSGFPSAWVNRRYDVVPMVKTETPNGLDYTTLNGGFETYLLKAQAEKTIAEITPTATFADGMVSVNTQVRFAVNKPVANYRLAYVVVEDRVEGDGFYQTNYYAEQTGYHLDGFEQMPEKIYPYVFDDVARSIAQHYDGIAESVPNTITAGETYEHTYSFAVDNVRNPANAHVVAMLIDGNTGFVVNAAKTTSTTTGINNVITRTTSGTPIVYDLTGRRVKQPRQGGVYIVNGRKQVMH